MKNLWDIVKANALAAILVGLVLGIFIWYFGGAVWQRAMDLKTDTSIQGLENKADGKLTEAHEASGAKKAEDLRREQEIKPKVDRANRDRLSVEIRRQKAEKDYEASLTNPRPNVALNELRERNCADYRELYFEDIERHCVK